MPTSRFATGVWKTQNDRSQATGKETMVMIHVVPQSLALATP